MDQEPLAPEATAPSAPHGTLFLNAEGTLRSGWSILFFLIFTCGLIYVLSTLVHHLLPHHPHQDGLTVTGSLIGYAITLTGVYLSMYITARLERRPLSVYNFSGTHRGRRFLNGLVWGFVALSVLIFSLDLGHWLGFGSQSLRGLAAFSYALLWGLAFLGTAFFEEGIFRCFLLAELTRGIGFWPAALVSSALFGAIHYSNNGEGYIGILSAAAVGFIFCLSVHLTGSAWWAIGFHAAWDWAETYFYGTADSGLQPQGHLLSTHPLGSSFWSGGATGPEGSILILPLIALLALAIFLTDRPTSARVS